MHVGWVLAECTQTYLGFRVQSLGFRIWGSGYRVGGFWLRVE